MCQRTLFDQSLIELAEKKGVFFQENKTVVDVIITREKAVIVLNDGEQIETQMVLGCDGIHSIVAEKTNLAEEHTHICVCMYQETPMSKKTLDALYSEKRTVHIFIKALGIAGYGWIFPKKKTVNVGLGVFESAVDTTKPKINLREIYTKFVAVLKEKNLLPPEFSGDDAKGGILPIFPLKKTYADRVLLCGDAAGFINPITGEGIYYAMVSGELAAQVAAKAITTHKTSQDFLSTYHKKWSSEFGDDLRLLGRFNSQWGKDSEKIVRLLSADKPLAKLTIGIMGGQLSFSKYRYLLYLRYLYASLKIALIYPGEKKK